MYKNQMNFEAKMRQRELINMQTWPSFWNKVYEAVKSEGYVFVMRKKVCRLAKTVAFFYFFTIPASSF